MPFDLSEITSPQIQMIDRLLAFFGPNGEHWMTGRFGDGEGRQCLVGAIRTVARQNAHLRGASVGQYIRRAIIRLHGPGTYENIMDFNDQQAWHGHFRRDRSGYTKIRKVLYKARELALEDALKSGGIFNPLKSARANASAEKEFA